MKKYILIISVIVFIGSCVIEDPPTTGLYIIKNNSGHKIKLEFYKTNFTETLILMINDSKEYSRYETGGVPGPPYFKTHADSIRVIYDDTIYITHYTWDYEGENVKRSIFLESSYTGGKESEYVYRYEYEFTEADYQEALDFNNVE